MVEHHLPPALGFKRFYKRYVNTTNKLSKALFNNFRGQKELYSSYVIGTSGEVKVKITVLSKKKVRLTSDRLCHVFNYTSGTFEDFIDSIVVVYLEKIHSFHRDVFKEHMETLRAMLKEEKESIEEPKPYEVNLETLDDVKKAYIRQYANLERLGMINTDAGVVINIENDVLKTIVRAESFNHILNGKTSVEFIEK